MISRNWEIRRGDLYLVDLNPYVGSEQGGKRPVVILSNNIGNRFSPTVIVAPLTTQEEDTSIPTHVTIKKAVYANCSDSVVVLEQIRVADRKRIKRYLGKLSKEQMEQVDISLMISLGLINARIPELRKKAAGSLRNSWKRNRRKKETGVTF